jgi:hypothetical protein
VAGLGIITGFAASANPPLSMSLSRQIATAVDVLEEELK